MTGCQHLALKSDFLTPNFGLLTLVCYRELVQEVSLKVGDIVEVTTERLAYGGEAVARHQGLAIFIPLAAPGERLRIRISERKKNFARAVIDKILESSPARREPPCPHFGDCGGCQLQHLAYEAQLEAKTGFIRDALERIGRIDWPREIKIRHGAKFAYRGRAQVQLDGKTHRVGFKRAASSSVCDIAHCPILVPELNEALVSLRGAFTGAIGTRSDQASASSLQVDMAAGESGVSFEPPPPGFSIRTLQRAVRGAVYNFSGATFFQVNPGLLDGLVDEAVSEYSGDVAIDLYAGVGLFTIQLARSFNHVIGIESDPRTAKHAVENFAANAVTNAEFHISSAELWLKRFVETKAPSPDLILLDPPRSGAAGALPYIVALKPARISYVSCDPATLARDLRPLIDSGYELSRVTAIDLFPQTYHVETIASLVRCDKT